MERIVAIVGFLGAGKTTLLKHLAATLITEAWRPYVILNDYVDAELDAQRIYDSIQPSRVTALSGSCICCDGIHELRRCVNSVPPRKRGITLIEANGTSDASLLMGFLGVGLASHFLPPVQVSAVDAKNWQKRGVHNALEAEQVKVSSLILQTHLDGVTRERVTEVSDSLRRTNPQAKIVTKAELKAVIDSGLEPVACAASNLEHSTTHWSSCSVDLPELPNAECIKAICDLIPPEVLRIKGCTKVGSDNSYTYFERCPDGEVYVRFYPGVPVTGSKLLTVGPGSEPTLLQAAVAQGLAVGEGSATP